MPTNRLSIIAFAAVLSLAGATQALTPPPGDMPPHHEGMGGMGEGHEMHAQARMKALHDALGIRPDQEAAFEAFAGSMRPAAMGRDMGGPGPGHEGPGSGRAMAGPMTAPDRVDMMVKRFDEHSGRMREALARHAQAVKTFYAALSPDQRRVLDALPVLMGHGMGPMGHMGHPGMGHGGDMGPEHPGMGE